jgi:hypothetical protein
MSQVLEVKKAHRKLKNRKNYRDARLQRHTRLMRVILHEAGFNSSESFAEAVIDHNPAVSDDCYSEYFKLGADLVALRGSKTVRTLMSRTPKDLRAYTVEARNIRKATILGAMREQMRVATLES